MTMDSWVAIGIFVISLLLSGNIWFVRRLVIKLDSVEQTVTERLPVQQTEIKNLSEKMQHMEASINGLASDLKDVGQLRERVAVLEYAGKVKHKK